MSQHLINKSVYSTSTRSKGVIYSEKESKFAFNEKEYSSDKNHGIIRNQAVAYLKNDNVKRSYLCKPMTYNKIIVRHMGKSTDGVKVISQAAKGATPNTPPKVPSTTTLQKINPNVNTSQISTSGNPSASLPKQLPPFSTKKTEIKPMPTIEERYKDTILMQKNKEAQKVQEISAVNKSHVENLKKNTFQYKPVIANDENKVENPLNIPKGSPIEPLEMGEVSIIPPAPPLPPSKILTSIPPTKKDVETTLSEEIKNSYKKHLDNPQIRDEAVQKLKELQEKKDNKKLEEYFLIERARKAGLIHPLEESLTFKAYSFLPTTDADILKITINLSQFNTTTKDTLLGVGLLKITEIEKTVALKGLHTHMNILYHINDKDHAIVYAFLTSAKIDNTILLTDNQPFGENKKQYLAVLKQPFIVNKSHIENLPFLSKETQEVVKDPTDFDKVINQQNVIENYIKEKEVNIKLQHVFINQTLSIIKNQEGSLPIYNGTGITVDDLSKMIASYEVDLEKKAINAYNEYKQKTIQFSLEKGQKYLNSIQKNQPDVYEKLITKINHEKSTT